MKKSLLGYINKEIIGNPGMSNFSGMMGSTKEAEIDGKKLEGEETEIVMSLFQEAHPSRAGARINVSLKKIGLITFNKQYS